MRAVFTPAPGEVVLTLAALLVRARSLTLAALLVRARSLTLAALLVHARSLTLAALLVHARSLTLAALLVRSYCVSSNSSAVERHAALCPPTMSTLPSVSRVAV
jgi:hypothetical protein